jgi:Ser/Thr protein kinase RdoA (MazF antagonist)
MTDARELLNAWGDALKAVRGAAAPATEPLEKAIRRQLDFDRALVSRAMAPLSVVLDALEGTAQAMRTQSDAFEAAAAAFKQSADLLDVQAAMLEKAIEALRDPAEFVRSAGGLAER